MKALVCSSLGSFDDLSVADVAEPTPGDDEVVVDVVAAALNFPDLLVVAGKYQIKPELPFVAGGEAAGIVSEVGRDVVALKPGDRVAVVGSVGAFAEKTLKKENEVIRIPDGMGFDVAAGFCVAYGTSYYALKQCGHLQREDSVLILGAAGGVGLAAVDISQALGARVIAAASDDGKLELAKTLGAKEGIRYDRDSLKTQTKALTGGKGVDIVFDPVGGDASEQALRAIAWDGRFLVVGFAAGDIPCVPLNLALLKNCSIRGVFFGAWAQRYPDDYSSNFEELFAMFSEGLLNPVVSEAFSLGEFRGAFESLAQRRAKGKIILRIQDENR